MNSAVRRIAWVKDTVFGVEFADAAITPTTLTATGVAIGDDPMPYRLDYTLETTDGFVTSRLLISTCGEGWRRTLDLRRADPGSWSADATTDGEPSLPEPGGDMTELAGAMDCDIAFSPLTNSMPVLRHDMLHTESAVEFLMAWVSVPDLSVAPSAQRYTPLSGEANGRRVRYESIGGTFVADLSFDQDGLVIDYPQLARRLT